MSQPMVEFRTTAYQERLINDVQKGQLVAAEHRGPLVHNDLLLSYGASNGTRQSFRRLLATVEKMGHDEKREELEELLVREFG